MITTPIFYVNASPHIGHTHSCILADAISRWYKMNDRETFFCTGTDEHGLKIQEASQKANKSSQEFCDALSLEFKDIFEKSECDYDVFIRTTQEKHKRAVEYLWNRLQQKGYIYKSNYSGYYSISDECFIKKNQVKQVQQKDGSTKYFTESMQPVEWITEENYMFKMKSFEEKMINFLKENKNFIVPESRYNEVITFLEEGNLVDISISRLSQKLHWGIKVPNDPSHTIYVWFDALINYLTVTNFPENDFDEIWPADLHILGKDILRFHAVFWPIFLMAADLPLPKKICAHGIQIFSFFLQLIFFYPYPFSAHWTIDKMKMSKSKGNVVDPRDLIEEYGVDVFRYFLLSESGLQDDTDFSHLRIRTRRNQELGNNLGNLLKRSVSPSLNKNLEIPPFDPTQLFEDEKEFIREIEQTIHTVSKHYYSLDFREGISCINQCFSSLNKMWNIHEPWKLIKKNDLTNEDHIRIQHILYLTIHSIRILSHLLLPIMPSKINFLLDLFQIPKEERNIQSLLQSLTCFSQPQSSIPLSTQFSDLILFPK